MPGHKDKQVKIDVRKSRFYIVRRAILEMTGDIGPEACTEEVIAEVVLQITVGDTEIEADLDLGVAGEIRNRRKRVSPILQS